MKPERGRLLVGLPPAGNGERFEEIVRARSFRVERIVSRGQTSPAGFWYDQDEDEWVVVLEGSARLELDDGSDPVNLAPGDWIFLPARCRHRVAWTDPDRATVWLAIHGL